MNIRTMAALAVGLSGVLAHAQLVDLRTDTDESTDTTIQDGILGVNEYGAGNSYLYGGGGTGFGGTLGNGTLYMDYDSTNLNVGFQAGGNLNDNVVILIDSKAGGFTDSTMNDTGDPGRNLSTNLTRDVLDLFPTGFEADYSIVIGSFGMVSFELTGGSLNFLQYDGTFTGNGTGFREWSLSRSSLGMVAPGSGFDFFVAYGSDSNYMSNEGIPGQSFAGGANLGFDNNGTFQDVTWSYYDRFQAVPEPATLIGVAACLLGLRRRKK